MRNPRVFAVQVPARRDGPRGGWTEKYDISAAEAFGSIVRVLPYGNVPNDPGPTRSRLNEAFFGDPDRPFDYDADLVLLLGDPVAIAQAVSILEGRRPAGKSIRVLKWDRRGEEYTPYSVG